MKSIIAAFLILAVSVSLGWGEPRVWTIPRHVNVVAKEVQARISDKAHEGLFEAKCLKNVWLYACKVGYEKAWSEDVQIKLTRISFKEPRMQVDAFRIEKGVLFDNRSDAPDLTTNYNRLV
jgi:hypothetical protein